MMYYVKKANGYVMTLSEELRAVSDKKARPINDILYSGKPYYVIVSNSGACDICAAKHGVAYHVSGIVEGETYPPFHPHCKCDVRPYDENDKISIPSASPFENPSFGADPNDWRFFGWNGDEYNATPREFYTDDYFGKAIPIKSQRQSEVDMHIVDRIARTLYEEQTNSRKSQAAMVWEIFNRCINQNSSLFNVLTYENQFEVFGNEPIRGGNYHAFEPAIESNGWKSALELGKMLVSVVCNPNLKDAAKIAMLDSWAANPFADGIVNVGTHVADPNKMTQHRSEAYWNRHFDGTHMGGYKIMGYVNIGGNVFFQTA